MIRRNIFQILSEQKDISTEFTHLDNFFKNRKVVRKGIGKEYSLKEFVELFCFDTWASNGYCVNLDEFLARVKYSFLAKRPTYLSVRSVNLLRLQWPF